MAWRALAFGVSAYNAGMQIPALRLIFMSLFVGACGMKGDLYEQPPPPAPVPAPTTPAAETAPGVEADQDEDGRKTLPATPPPELAQ